MLLAVLAGVQGLFTFRYPADRPAPGDVRHLICLALILVLLPVAFWIVSQLGRPIFYPRYMLPSAIGWAILVAAAAQRFLSAGISRALVGPGAERLVRPGRFLALSIGAAGLLFSPLDQALHYRGRDTPRKK